MYFGVKAVIWLWFVLKWVNDPEKLKNLCTKLHVFHIVIVLSVNFFDTRKQETIFYVEHTVFRVEKQL